MKIKTVIVISAAAAVGYFIAKDKLQKGTVKMLVKQDLFESSEAKNINEQSMVSDDIVES